MSATSKTFIYLCIQITVAVNTLNSKQNFPHFKDDIFRGIFMIEGYKILLKFVTKFDNIAALDFDNG